MTLLRCLLLAGAGFLAAVGLTTHWSVSWLGWVALLPLLRAVQVSGVRRAAAVGMCWGGLVALFSWCLSGGEWLGGGLGVCCLVVLPGLYGLLGSHATRRVGFNPVLLGLGWVLVELGLRPLGFRYGLLASTQGSGGLLTTLGPVFGYFSIAFLLALFGGLFLSAISGLEFRLPERVVAVYRVPLPGRLMVPVGVCCGRCVRDLGRPRAPPR